MKGNIRIFRAIVCELILVIHFCIISRACTRDLFYRLRPLNILSKVNHGVKRGLFEILDIPYLFDLTTGKVKKKYVKEKIRCINSIALVRIDSWSTKLLYGHNIFYNNCPRRGTELGERLPTIYLPNEKQKTYKICFQCIDICNLTVR